MLRVLPWLNYSLCGCEMGYIEIDPARIMSGQLSFGLGGTQPEHSSRGQPLRRFALH